MATFQEVLLQISEGLRSDNLDAMKFLCSLDIGKKKLQNVKRGTELFQYLIETNKIGEDNTPFLRSLLSNVNRHDLICLLDNFERCGPCPSETELDPHEQEQLDIADKIIAENLDVNWRAYGRKLEVPDARLDHIMMKYPYNLQEQVVELLREWRKMRGKEASVKTLIDTLRSGNWNLTADLVERALLQQHA